MDSQAHIKKKPQTTTTTTKRTKQAKTQQETVRVFFTWVFFSFSFKLPGSGSSLLSKTVFSESSMLSAASFKKLTLK